MTDLVLDARQLAAEGRHHDAIALLSDANRSAPNAHFEIELVRLRHDAFRRPDAGAGRWPEPFVTGERAGGAFVTLSPQECSARAVRGSILSQGFALVRGLLETRQVEQLTEDIDHALAAFDAHRRGEPPSQTAPWYVPFVPPSDGTDLDAMRRRARVSGSVWTADSPRALFDLVETLDATGLRDLATEYLGEPPAMSLTKGTLRRVPLDSVYAAWHQDGAFLGEGVRTLNIWMALTDCGTDAPGLEFLPRRLSGVVETGTEGAMFPWTVSPTVVEEVAAGVDVCRPDLAAGDVLLFDELFLHRTATTATMVRERHAIETWLFAPSSYPADAVPLQL